jgi:hypothetical protein
VGGNGHLEKGSPSVDMSVWIVPNNQFSRMVTPGFTLIEEAVPHPDGGLLLRLSVIRFHQFVIAVTLAKIGVFHRGQGM